MVARKPECFKVRIKGGTMGQGGLVLGVANDLPPQGKGEDHFPK